MSSPFGPVSSSTVLDNSGSAALRYANPGNHSVITNMSIRASTAINEAQVNVYRNNIGSLYRLSGSYAGSTGDNNTDPIDLPDGDCVFVVWTGGDVGATVTLTVSGTQDVDGGFRAMV